MEDLDEDAVGCEVSGCDRSTRGGRTYCEMHYKRKQRGLPLHAKVQERLPIRERVIQNAIDLADADTDDDRAYAAALERLKKSVVMWARSIFAAKGGKARAAQMTAEQRSELARRVALARWGKQ